MLGGAVALAMPRLLGAPDPASQSDAAVPASPTTDTAIEAPVAPNIVWDFIKELPKAEVRTGVEPVEPPPAADPGPREYVVFVAQFLREEDAQVQQAELMLAGYPVNLSSSPRERGGAWHRVTVGPYATEGHAQRALNELRAQDFPAQMLARSLAGSAPPT